MQQTHTVDNFLQFTPTNLLAIVYADKKFRNTEFYSNSIVITRLNSEIGGLAVTKKFLLNQDFDCSKWPIILNIGPTIDKRIV